MSPFVNMAAPARASRRTRVSAILFAVAVSIGVGPALSALSGQGPPPGTAGAVQIQVGMVSAVSGIRYRFDSLSRVLESLTIDDPRRPKVLSEYTQTAQMIGRLMSPSMATSSIGMGIVVDNSLQDAIRRASDGQRLLRDALPKGMLGFTVSSGLATQDMRPDGLYVTYFEHPIIKLVDPNSPADSAGMVAGARLIAYNGIDVCGVRINLNRLLQPSKPVRVDVRVDGQLKEYSVTVADASDVTQQRRVDAIMDVIAQSDSSRRSQQITSPPGRAPASGGVVSGGINGAGNVMVFQTVSSDSGGVSCDQPSVTIVRATTSAMAQIAGMEVTALDLQLKTAYGLSDGVYVKQTTEGTAAAKARIFSGDVILRVGSVKITSVAELRRQLDVKPGEKVQIELMRKGKSVKVEIQPK